jgi:hypothetical protein
MSADRRPSCPDRRLEPFGSCSVSTIFRRNLPAQPSALPGSRTIGDHAGVTAPWPFTIAAHHGLSDRTDSLWLVPSAQAPEETLQRKRWRRPFGASAEGWNRRCQADSQVVHPRAQQISRRYCSGMNTNGGPSWTSPARGRSMENFFPITACPRGLVAPCPYDREVGMPLRPQARRLTAFRAEFYLSWGCPKIAPPSTWPVEACRPTRPTSMSALQPGNPLAGMIRSHHLHQPSASSHAPPPSQLPFPTAVRACEKGNQDDSGNGPAGNGSTDVGESRGFVDITVRSRTPCERDARTPWPDFPCGKPS